MQIRLGTVISALAMAFLIYAGMVTIVIRKIELLIPCGIQGTPTSTPPDDHSLLFFVGVNVCAFWLAGQIIFYLRRRSNRHREGFCAGCGKRLEMNILRCPLCGEKRPLFGSTEPLFPVIIKRPEKKQENEHRRHGLAF